MASSSLTKCQPQVPFDVSIRGLILKDGCTYILEPPMQEEKSTISIACIVHAIMGPLPTPDKKHRTWRSFSRISQHANPLCLRMYFVYLPLSTMKEY